MKIKRFAVLAAAACAAVFAAGAAAAESAVGEALSRGALRVGLSSFTPWAMRAQDGEMVGFEVDVARELARDMDVELELVPTAWDGIIPALAAKKFDVIISGMFITPKRALRVLFTEPYQYSRLDMVANRELAGGFDSFEDFNSEEVIFALRRGAAPVEFTSKQLPRAQILQFDDDATALQEVLNGRAHAWITAAPQPRFAAIKHPQKLFRPLAVLQEGVRTPSGFALRKGDFESLAFFNSWIRIKSESGWLRERYDYWFNTRDWAHLLGE